MRGTNARIAFMRKPGLFFPNPVLTKPGCSALTVTSVPSRRRASSVVKRRGSLDLPGVLTEVQSISGRYFVDRKATQPVPQATDMTVAGKLWEIDVEKFHLTLGLPRTQRRQTAPVGTGKNPGGHYHNLSEGYR